MSPRSLPNQAIADALAVFNPTLAYKVLNCWQPPFYHPCRQFTFCLSCARYNQSRLLEDYERHLAQMVTPWWLTLTIPCGPRLTRWHLTRFRKRLTSLRRWRRFRRSVRGGLYTIEIKLGKSGLWNIHAHVVLDLADLTLTEPAMKAAWHRRTGGFMVEFEPIRAGTLARVLSYSTKPQALPGDGSGKAAINALTRPQEVPLDPQRLRELWIATWNFRRRNTFGSFHHDHGKLPSNRRGLGQAARVGGSR